MNAQSTSRQSHTAAASGRCQSTLHHRTQIRQFASLTRCMPPFHRREQLRAETGGRCPTRSPPRGPLRAPIRPDSDQVQTPHAAQARSAIGSLSSIVIIPARRVLYRPFFGAVTFYPAGPPVSRRTVSAVQVTCREERACAHGWRQPRHARSSPGGGRGRGSGRER